MKCSVSSTPRRSPLFSTCNVWFCKSNTSLSSAAKTEPCSLDKKKSIAFVFEPAKLVKNCSLEARSSDQRVGRSPTCIPGSESF